SVTSSSTTSVRSAATLPIESTTQVPVPHSVPSQQIAPSLGPPLQTWRRRNSRNSASAAAWTGATRATETRRAPSRRRRNDMRDLLEKGADSGGAYPALERDAIANWADR